MSASSLPQIDGFTGSAFGLRAGLPVDAGANVGSFHLRARNGSAAGIEHVACERSIKNLGARDPCDTGHRQQQGCAGDTEADPTHF